MVVIADRHHLPDQAVPADHDSLVGGNRAVMTEHRAASNLDSSPALEGETVVENAADAKAHSCASGHSELSTPTNVTEVAERHPRMAEPCENQAHTTTRIAPSPVKGAKLSSRGQATALGTASN